MGGAGVEEGRIARLLEKMTPEERRELDLLLAVDSERNRELIKRAMGEEKHKRGGQKGGKEVRERAVEERWNTFGWRPAVVEAYAGLMLKNEVGESLRAAAHHKLWLKLLCDDQIKRLLIIAPPESAKTTWAVSSYLGAKVGFFPERSWILASVTETVAEKRTQSIRMTTERKEWQRLFPGMARAHGMTYVGKEWSIAPGGRPRPGRIHPTMSAYGVGGSITGARADEILVDDVLDRDNTRTAYQREEVFNWWHNSLLSRRKSRVGRVVVIGTSWHEDDLYSRLRRSGDFVVCRIPLLSEGEDVYAELEYPTWWDLPMLGEEDGARAA